MQALIGVTASYGKSDVAAAAPILRCLVLARGGGWWKVVVTAQPVGTTRPSK